MIRLVEWCKERSISLVVDESFVDFSEQSLDNTLLTNKILEKYPNLIVVKSISSRMGCLVYG